MKAGHLHVLHLKSAFFPFSFLFLAGAGLDRCGLGKLADRYDEVGSAAPELRDLIQAAMATWLWKLLRVYLIQHVSISKDCYGPENVEGCPL